jgi:hypothetical protein
MAPQISVSWQHPMDHPQLLIHVANWQHKHSFTAFIVA